MSESDKKAPAPKKKSQGATGVRDRRNMDDSAMLDEETLDPGKTYRFVQNRQLNVAKKRRKGYEFVKEGKVKTLTGQEDKRGDGRIHHGDRVLMAAPKGVTQKRREGHKQLNETRLSNTGHEAVDKARSAGVRIVKGDSGSEPPDKEEG